MSRVLTTFEFVDGLRNSKQILYQNNLFCKHSGIQCGAVPGALQC